MKYLDFLKALLALGPKLPAVIALVQHIVNDVQEIINLLSPETFAAARVAQTTALIDGETITADVLESESRVLTLLPKETVIELNSEFFASAEGENVRGIGDGTFLRAIWAFMQANPQLLTFLFSLLAQK